MAIETDRSAAARPYAGADRAAAADIDVGLRQYMLRVYNYMASGLALLSAGIALLLRQPQTVPVVVPAVAA